MAITTRQNNLLVNQDWTKIYESFQNADFQSYDFQTLRKAMIDYLKLYYPEDFNDFIESSEYIALIDLIAFLGQNLAFRTDLNARENFIDTAERRDSVLKLASLVSYIPKRNIAASGLIKVDSIQTTESLTDSNGINLNNIIINWNDTTNPNWYEQFVTILNASLPTNQQVGKPANSADLSGIKTDEYNLNIPSNAVPIYKFNTQVQGATLDFEVVSGTTVDQEYIYEVSPNLAKPLNILYQNDNLGNGSNATGFFFYFKQGTMSSFDFSITESIPNNVVNVNYNNVNNTDVWLYQLSNLGQPTSEWSKIPSVVGNNIIFNNNAAKNSFQVSSRANDQISLVFGDGTFAAIPKGNFRVYYRQSSGLSYTITPDNLQNINITVPYLSKNGRIETITFVCSLKYSVTNARARESLTDIKLKAPQQYYTQNRMISAEDYNIFPYTQFSSISKVKAVNRSSSGISRYLDVADNSGRYSSTNIFAEDGVLYKQSNNTSFTFSWNTSADINKVIRNQILPLIRGQKLLHFYYGSNEDAGYNFTRFGLTDLFWKKVTVGSGSSTGYFENANSFIQPIGQGSSGNNYYMNPSSIVVFSPGSGKYFNAKNEIVDLPTNQIIPPNGKDKLYVAIVTLIGNGSAGVLDNGQGAVTLSENIPTGAQATVVIPAFSNTFTNSFIQTLITLISTYNEFGIRYDQYNRSWAVITEQNLNPDANTFSLTYQGSTAQQQLDNSWLVKLTANGPIYTVVVRGLDYIFNSVSQTRFYYDNRVKTYDPVTGLTVNDSINVLKVNGNPDTELPLQEDYLWYVYDQIKETDGYVDPTRVLITYSDQNDDGVPDNPDIFDYIVQPNTEADPYKLVFYQKTYGYNSFITYSPYDNELVNISYATKVAILPYLNDYVVGQVFYTTTEQKFYINTLVNSVLTLVESTDFIARTGRQSLYFQYKHNSPGNRRIDPSPNNIIDLYVLTKSYDETYRAWALDSTNTLTEPDLPTSQQLSNELNTLEDYKAVSDSLIYSPARFKLLFGNKASPELRAIFKIVKNSNITISDTEIRSQTVALINTFFSSENWEFGETFYFTELATYIQQGLAPNVSSIIIVPSSANQVYGSLQQITAQPDEILLSCATVENVEVITSITAAQLNLQNTAVNTIVI